MPGSMRGSRGGPLGRHDVAAGSKPNLFSTLPTTAAEPTSLFEFRRRTVAEIEDRKQSKDYLANVDIRRWKSGVRVWGTGQKCWTQSPNRITLCVD